MKIEKNQPPAVYTLTLDYMDLHALYHVMLDFSRDAERNGCSLSPTLEEFFLALKAHA